MKLFVTGASGLLGGYLVRAAHDVGTDAVLASRRSQAEGFVQVDLADSAAAHAALDAAAPQAIVHAAALADVDGCESDPARAGQVNAAASGNVADWAAEHGARVVYVSTDSVFDGERGRYREDDAVSPLNEYARTKLEGERRVATAENHIVVRTNFFARSGRGAGLAEWILRELSAGREITGFTDVRFSPLYAAELARQLLILADRDERGVLHLGSSDAVSKFEFGRLLAEAYGFDPRLVRPGTTADVPLRARRPLDTSLDTSRAQSILGPLPSVVESIRAMRSDTR